MVVGTTAIAAVTTVAVITGGAAVAGGGAVVGGTTTASALIGEVASVATAFLMASGPVGWIALGAGI